MKLRNYQSKNYAILTFMKSANMIQPWCQGSRVCSPSAKVGLALEATASQEGQILEEQGLANIQCREIILLFFTLQHTARNYYIF
ncbi:unnamed protein product [Leptosia nina]|uniref:Uncharacterized protein n=1 Tax=Leptosia nina TaxID=320188 RepID=A0AAV1JEK8_9NEOP